MASQSIADRFQQLEAEADKAGATARRHEVARQGAERLKLQAECGQAGHYYAANYNPICLCCGFDKEGAAKTIARNLGTVAPMRDPIRHAFALADYYPGF